jgi:hypothetical protein
MLINSFPLKTSTWANRPTTAQVGDLITITDIGPVDEVFKYNGTRWAPINGQCLIYSINTSVSVTGTTSQTELGSVTMPGGLMSANGILEVSTFWTVTNSANNKTLKVKIGETSDPASGGTSFMNRTETTILIHQHLCVVRNANSTSSQKGHSTGVSGGVGSSTLAITTASYDTTTDKKIFLTGQLSNTGETITLRGWRLLYKE